MRGWAVLLLPAALAAACSQPASNAVPEAANAVNAAAPTLPDCPETQLSCGRQRPIVSDGITPFVNESYYLAMVFPRGSQVCATRSGDAPHGFFAVYGAPPGCPERPNRPPRFITLYAEYNALFITELSEIVPDGCRPLAGDTRRRLSGPGLSFPGSPSILCETRAASNRFEISVYTLAGPSHDGDGPGAPRIRAATYFMTLGTDAAHFDEDLVHFRAVLASVRIGTEG